MRITIAAIGRLKAGPERLLHERYLDRAVKAGRQVGLTFATREFPESRASSTPSRTSQEASALLAAVPATAVLVALDARGIDLASDTFARRLAEWRDSNSSEAVFAIGGADGLGASVTERSDLCLSFGAMTWPHQIIRLMLAEQLYRAVTILSGHPYHRG